MTHSLDGQTILLTGGTGSFGRAFIDYALSKSEGSVIRVFSRDEFKQSEIREDFGDTRLRFLIGDVRDRYRLRRAAQGVNLIVHAAAMKQVPACEYNPFEAVQTNVIGGQHVAEAAIDAGVPKVVAISTDKAVNPVNLYGATKLCAEKIFVQGNAYAATSNTRMCCVRYGNVVGSRGSVLPLFQRQKEEGLITITDERMTRFWITLRQGVELVVTAAEEMHGGEIFIPKIPSIKVTDLAEAVAPDIPRKTIGIRPGEKVHEMLVTSNEARHTIDVGDRFVILPEHPWWSSENRWMEGRLLDQGFTYTSDTNDQWLSVEELRATIT